MPTFQYNIFQINSGGQGSVLLCKNIATDQYFAIKKISCESLEELNFALGEAQAVLKLQHPYIVECDSFFIERSDNTCERVCIVYEYCESGSLDNVIAKHRKSNRIIERTDILRWIEQIALGVAYIHKRRIIHRDLKPANIFLTKASKDVKIGDFGFAKIMSIKNSMTNTVLGTRCFTAPEIKVID